MYLPFIQHGLLLESFNKQQQKEAHIEAWRQSTESQKQASANGAKNSAKNARKVPQKTQPPFMIWSSWRRIIACAKNLQKRKRKSFPKKSDGILRKGNRLEAYRFIDEYRDLFGVRWLLQRLEIYPNAYYIITTESTDGQKKLPEKKYPASNSNHISWNQRRCRISQDADLFGMQWHRTFRPHGS